MNANQFYRRLSHVLVTATLFLTALAAEVHQEAVTVSPGSPSFSVDFGTVDPGDMLELTITGLPEGLESASASPSAGPGAWNGGLTAACGTAVFTATIPSDYSGTHTGDFSGAFCLSGEGSGPPPTWSGESEAVVCSFDRVEIDGTPSSGGTTPHGSQGEYTVTAYDEDGNDITDLVDFNWKKIEFPLRNLFP